MEDKLSFILKVLFLSAGLSFIIKYLTPQLNIPATATNALVAVILPTLLITVALAWRLRKAGEEG